MHAGLCAKYTTAPDPFTRKLQKLTEEEVLQLTNKRLQVESPEEDEEEEEVQEVVNLETGERYGPRGKEPTRFGDWEIRGRCSDF